METLLTEIISFFGNCEEIPAYAAGTQLRLYFSMLRVLEPLCRMVRTIMDPHLLQRPLSAQVGFAALLSRICAMMADQDLAANEREK
jgi:hypothetical protein